MLSLKHAACSELTTTAQPVCMCSEVQLRYTEVKGLMYQHEQTVMVHHMDSELPADK